MNPFDIRTVLFSQFLTYTLSTVVLVILWLRNRKRYNGILYWILDLFFQACAVLFILLRGKIPNWMSFELSNFLIMGGAMLGFVGMEHFIQKRTSQAHNFVLFAAFAAGYLYYLEIAPSLPARNLLISLGLFGFCFQCAWLVYRRIDQTERHTPHLVGAAYIGFCMFSLARIGIIVLVPNSTNDFFQSGLYDTLILLAYQILLILLTFGLVMMVNQKLLEEVRLEEEKFSKAFRSSPYAITLTRITDGKILEVNDGFQAITGYRFDEAIGKTTQELQLWVNAEDRTIVTSELRKGNPVKAREFPFRKKNGQIIAGLISSDIILINKQPWILSSIEDISERKKSENRLKEYSDQLEEKVAARTQELKVTQEKLVRHERLAVLGQLAGSVGHELRGPLGVMANAIYFLKIAQPNAEPKIKEYLNILQSEIINSDKIITDLLDFSRIKNAEQKETSIEARCKQVLDRYPAPEGIKVNLEFQNNLPKVFADPKQIEQVLGNLVLNAYQSMPDSGTLTISAEEKDKEIEVVIKDTGVGIPKKDIDQLFDPLFTTKPRGIGLGLTVSKMLVEANGGRIKVSSEEGKGSFFYGYFTKAGREGMKAKLQILIVDDDRNMAHTLADILAISGYDPLEANTPKEALNIVNEKQVDCVLTDVRMEGMSGVELFEEIIKVKPNLPVVLMTAYAPDDQIRHGLKSGAMGLLTKPLEINHLLSFLTLLSNERCIAVVDDDPAFCKTLADILTRRGYSVKVVSDPEKVFKAITPKVQSVLLDMKLNGTSGQEVLVEIRKKFSDVPVVLITAYRREMSVAIEKALELDAFACLYKPLDIQQLLQTLDNILKNRLKKALEEK